MQFPKPLLLLLFSSCILFFSCHKDEAYLFRNTGVWEIQTMKIDYLNSGGGTDSTVTSPISGFFMFYNTPSDPPVVFEATCGITVHKVETHNAYYYVVNSKDISLQMADGTVKHTYTISEKKRNTQTWDYTGPVNGLYDVSYTGNVREHITLKREQY